MIALFLATTVIAQPTTAPSTQSAFQIVGQIDAPLIRESSGIIASRKYPGVFWTHNDGQNAAAIFAITREGKLINIFGIRAPNVDWEDIAIDDAGNLYLADIGNNTGSRLQVQVYRVPEPDPRGPVDPLQPDRVWKLKYPDKPFDAESLFVLGDFGYIISKHRDGEHATVYRFNLSESAEPVTLEKFITLPLRTPVTAADVSRDGKWLAIMTVIGPVIYRIDGNVAKAADPDAIPWSALFVDPVIEGVCFVTDGLLATTESRRIVSFPFGMPER